MSVSGVGISTWQGSTTSSQTKNKLNEFLSVDADPTTATNSNSNSTSKLTIAPVQNIGKSDPAKELDDYMKMTDAQKMQFVWLKAHGISKEQFDAMSPDDKQKLISQMQAEIKQKVEQAQGTHPAINIQV